MNQIEAIKAEVERRIKENERVGFFNNANELASLLPFIESLEKEQPQGLDEAAEKAYPKKDTKIFHSCFGTLEIDKNAAEREAFKAGAKWMAGNIMPPEQRMSHPLFLEGFDLGRKVEKAVSSDEQSVDGFVLESCSPCCIDEMPTQRCIKLLYEEDDTNFVQAGDHVKVKIEKQ